MPGIASGPVSGSSSVTGLGAPSGSGSRASSGRPAGAASSSRAPHGTCARRYPNLDWPTPMAATVTLLTDYGLQRRVRGRLPRRDRADRARRARHRPDPRRPAPRHPRRRRSPCAARCRSRPAGVHVAVVDPGVGGPRRGVALRCGGPAARRARQRPADARRGAPRRRRGGRRPRARRRGGWSRCRRPSTAATCSRRSRRISPRASRSRTPGEPLEPDELVPLALPEPRREGVALVAHALAFDTLRQRAARRRRAATLPGGPSASRSPAAGCARVGGPSATSRTASCCSTRTPPARSRWRSTAARRATSSACGSTTRSASHDARRAAPAPARDRLHERPRARARDRGAPHGTLVTTDHQVAGRGRQGRTWASPARPRAPDVARAARASRRCSRSRRASRSPTRSGAGAPIKWPNDVLLDARKVAGHPRRGAPAGGLGRPRDRLNVALRPDDFPPELGDRAGTLGRAPEDVPPCSPPSWPRWSAASRSPPTGSSTPGAPATPSPAGWSPWDGGRGTADGIDEDGRLRVRLRRGAARPCWTPGRSTLAPRSRMSVCRPPTSPPPSRRRSSPTAGSSRATATGCSDRAPRPRTPSRRR